MTATAPHAPVGRRLAARILAAPLLLPLLALPAASQTLGQGSDDGIAAWRVVAVLLLCLGLAVFAAYALKARMGGMTLPRLFAGSAHTRRMQLVETLRLSHQIDLCIVACDGREILVAASAKGAQMLRPLDAPADM